MTLFGGGPPAIYAAVAGGARTLRGADLAGPQAVPGRRRAVPGRVDGAPGGAPRGSKSTRVTACRKLAPISGTTAASGVLRPGSVGKPVPGAVVQVVDLHTGLQRAPARPKGRGAGPRPAHDDGLPQSIRKRPPGPSATGSSTRAISATSTRQWPPVPRRPQEGRGVRQGLQRLPARGRGGDPHSPERRDGRRRRRAGRAHWRRAPGRLRRAPNGRNGRCVPRSPRTARRGWSATSGRPRCGWSGACPSRAL